MSTPQLDRGIPFIPETAPFSPDQRAWLNGFLAGLITQSGDLNGSAHDAGPGKPLTILYGSETGNTESLARKTAKAASKAGFEVTISCMSKFAFHQMKTVTNLLILTSTYGDGEPPSTAADFYASLHDSAAPQLNGLRYSVLALGDSSYPDFCKCGKDIDARLEQLEAERMVPRTDCDVDYDEPYTEWSRAVFTALDSAIVETSETGTGKPLHDRKNPFPARLVDNRNLNGSGSDKETRHIAISLEGSRLDYQPGDALGVYPVNCPHAVADLINILGFDPAHPVDDKSLSRVLMEDVEMTRLTPAYLRKHGEWSNDPRLHALLAGTPEEQASYCQGREIIDLLADFPAPYPDPKSFLATLRKMSPRLYSISSSPKTHPGEVHLTVGTVRYTSHGRQRKGVCSTYLAERCGDQPVRVYVHNNDNFRLSADGSRPVIMIGPGTGIAPFRAFLEEREATAACGENWLFFGDQHAMTDFLYQEELKHFLAAGVLHRLDTAFSRDQEAKIYVQDRMREQGARLFSWLERGAYLYICGDASRMARDVDQALHDIIGKHGGLGMEDTVDYVKRLKAEKRYCRDVY